MVGLNIVNYLYYIAFVLAQIYSHLEAAWKTTALGYIQFAAGH